LIYESSGEPLKVGLGTKMLTNQSPQVQVQIVTYNSESFLRDCIDALTHQSYPNFRVLVIDNGSSDDSVKIASAYSGFVSVVPMAKNIGYAGGHNQGFEQAINDGIQFVLTLNPDTELRSDYISRAVTKILANPRCGGVSGKLLRSSSVAGPGLIDSAGLQMQRFLHVRDRGSLQRDSELFSQPGFIWGTCGAASLYRVEMLNDVALYGHPFDETFFIYKEDVDLSWRANRRDWFFLYEPSAMAVHVRGWERGKRVAKNVVAQSFANQVALLIRHPPKFSFLVAVSVFVEVTRLAFMLVTRPNAAGLSIQLVVRNWRHNWRVRHVLRARDLVKASRLNDLCHPRYI
jgi:GT2 family glycosyltransferase